MNATMEPQALGALAGLILSLVMTYVPGLNARYAAMGTGAKQAIMGVLIVLAGTASALWACQEPLGVCVGGMNWKAWAVSVFSALVVNQTTDRISPEPEAVKDAKGGAAT